MKNLILTFCVSIILLTSCDKNDDSNNEKFPECLQITIDNYIAQFTPQAVRANLKKYNYHGNIVYAFDMGSIVESTTTIYDTNCNIVCGIGGIAGINTCDDWDSAEFIITLWTDDR